MGKEIFCQNFCCFKQLLTARYSYEGKKRTKKLIFLSLSKTRTVLQEYKRIVRILPSIKKYLLAGYAGMLLRLKMQLFQRFYV
jgi:hypothetical protein